MTNTGMIAKAVLTTATVGAVSQIPPIYIIALIGLVGGLIAYINEPKRDFKDAVTYLVSGALIAVTGTRYLVEKFMEGSSHTQEISIGIALVLGLLGHTFVRYILERKEGIAKLAANKITNKK